MAKPNLKVVPGKRLNHEQIVNWHWQATHRQFGEDLTADLAHLNLRRLFGTFAAAADYVEFWRNNG